MSKFFSLPLFNRIPLGVLLLIATVLPIYFYQLSSIPTNITGDEATYLGDVYKILFGNKFVSPLALLGDGSQVALNFYWMALWVKIFGLNNAIFGLRFSSGLWGTFVLIIFYYLMKRCTTAPISFFTTLLLGTSIWYLNFARGSWFNLGAIFLGLMMIYFWEKALQENKQRWFALSGLFAGLACYSYFGGKIYSLAAIFYLVIDSLSSKQPLTEIKKYFVFLKVFFLVLIPLIIVVLTHPLDYFGRPSMVFIFTWSQGNINLVYNQFKQTLLGLTFLDGSVIGQGVENLRYFPSHQTVVDPVIKILFFTEVVLAIRHKIKIGIWWLVYILSLIFLSAMTIDSPNLARAITVLPFIYFIAGLALNQIFIFLQKKFNFKQEALILCLVSFPLIWINVSGYFSWIQSPEVAQARQPALSFTDFPSWQSYQIQRVSQGLDTITIQQWEALKATNP
ncbi:MAG: glycosyltransferase family 39 protein [Patescibacteria group bacterium]|nr:glycosyltransferase family 39 protein [Patescibacteria group bacterium]